MSSSGKGGKGIVALTVMLLVFTSCRPSRDDYYKSGEKFLASKQFSEASIQFRNALKVDGGHVPSHLGLGRTLQQMGDAPHAVVEFRKVLNIDEKNIEAKLELGSYMLSAGPQDHSLYKQAADMAGEILKQDSSNIEARILLGNAYSGMGDIEGSVKELTQAFTQDPSNLHAALSLAAAQVHTDVAQAEKTFREASERHPDKTAAHLSLATFLTTFNRNNDAELYFRKAFDLAPADPKCLYSFAAFYVSIRKLDEAENVFKQAIVREPKAREPRWGLSEFYGQHGMADKALNVLLELVKMDPEDRQAQLNLGRLYLSRKDQARAEEIARALLLKKNNDAEAHQLLGSVFRTQQNVEKALEEFDTAIKLGGAGEMAYVEKANLLMARGDLDGANTTLLAGLQQNKGYALVRGFIAKILALRRQPQEALQEAQTALAAMPNNEDAIVARGDAFRDLGRLKESRDEFLKLVGMQQNQPFYLQRLGQVEVSLGEMPAALLHLRKAVEIRPDLPNGIADIVAAHIKTKQYDAALAELDRLSGVAAVSQEDIHKLRGQVYANKSDLASAEREFRKIIEINAQNYEAYILIAQTNLARNNLPQAIKEVDQLIARNNQSAAGFFLKGYYLEASKDIPGAMANYRRALALEPENPLFNNNLAWLLSRSDSDLDEALTLATKAKRIQPDDPEVADTLGWIYYKKKRYALAVDQLVLSVKNSPNPDAEHYYRLGVAYFAKGDVKIAHDSLRKALALNSSFPGSDDARQILQTPR